MKIVFFFVLIFILDDAFGLIEFPRSRHPCDRPCVKHERRTCVFRWTTHLWRTLAVHCRDCPRNKYDCFKKGCVTGDGRKRTIRIVNGQLPGPTIAVCEHDTIIIKLFNSLLHSDSVSIHWHGLHMRTTPHMDGVPFITQCPIFGHNMFIYKFQADPSGTHFYHSHTGLQRADGLAGPLIVRKAKDPLEKFYDKDLTQHILMVQDWFPNDVLSKFIRPIYMNFNIKPGGGNIGRPEDQVPENNAAKYKQRQHKPEPDVKTTDSDAQFAKMVKDLLEDDGLSDNLHEFMKLNNYGSHEGMKGNKGNNVKPIVKPKEKKEESKKKEATKTLIVNGRHGGKDSIFPWTTLKVKHNKRYRLRIISNAATTCPIVVTIDKHILYVISSDGRPIKPVKTDRLMLQAGERFDVVIVTDKKPDSYVIRFHGHFDCQGLKGHAILNYFGAPARTSYKLPEKKKEEKSTGDKKEEKEMTEKEKEDLEQKKKNEAEGESAIGLRRPRTFNVMGGVSNKYRLFYSEAKILKPRKMTHAHRRFWIPLGIENIDTVTMKNPFTQPIHVRIINGKRYIPILGLEKKRFKQPSSPILSQYYDIPKSEYCDQQPSTSCKKNELCDCVNRILLHVGEIVDLVLYDHAIHMELSHPMHLHGYAFQVLQTGTFRGNVTREKIMKKIDPHDLDRRSQFAPEKDTVAVPAAGFIVIRFKADNPGVWFFHCHVDFHSENGMATILQVGMPHSWRRPPNGFPRCGNFPPKKTGYTGI